MAAKAARAERRAQPRSVQIPKPPTAANAGSARSATPPWGAAVAVVAALALYVPSLHGGFIWDDPLVLQQLRAIRSWHDLFVLPAAIPKFYFRPFIFVTYLFDGALGGGHPFWFHVSVLAFHVVNVLLVYIVAARLLPRPLIATGAAALFAVAPTHVESVAWMAGRSDVIACTFMLLAVLLSLETTRPWTAWAAAASFLLAVLSKELALACLLLLPGLEFLRGGRLRWQRSLPLVLATLCYFALRHHAIGAVVGGMETGKAPPQLAVELLRAVGFYSIEAIVPINLCAYIPITPSAPPYLIAGMAALLAGGGLMILAWRRQRWQLTFLGLWCFTTLAPSLTVIVRRSASAPVADRYLYVPSVAIYMLMAWAVVAAGERYRIAPRWIAAPLVGLTLMFGVWAGRYTRVWADDLSFWTDVAAKVPDDAMPHRELGSVLLDRNRLDDAAREFERAAAIRSTPQDQAMTDNDLGLLYRRQGRYEDAERAFEAGIKLQPHPTLYHNLGMTLMAHLEVEQQQRDRAAMVRDIARARAAFEEALRLGSLGGTATPGFPQWDAAKTHALLGQVLFSIGDRNGAREHLETALRLDPAGPTAAITRQYMKKLTP